MSDTPSEPDPADAAGEAPDPAADVPPEPTTDDADEDGLIDRMRGTGVGVEDPTIVGEEGPVAERANDSPDTDDPGAVT